MSQAINEDFPCFTHADGTRFQVLNDAGTDWDEDKTSSALFAYSEHLRDLKEIADSKLYQD